MCETRDARLVPGSSGRMELPQCKPGRVGKVNGVLVEYSRRNPSRAACFGSSSLPGMEVTLAPLLIPARAQTKDLSYKTVNPSPGVGSCL